MGSGPRRVDEARSYLSGQVKDGLPVRDGAPSTVPWRRVARGVLPGDLTLESTLVPFITREIKSASAAFKATGRSRDLMDRVMIADQLEMLAQEIRMTVAAQVGLQAGGRTEDG